MTGCKPAATRRSRGAWGRAALPLFAACCLLPGVAAVALADNEPGENLRHVTPDAATIRHEGDRALFTIVWKGHASGARDCRDLLGQPLPDTNSSLIVYQSAKRGGPWEQVYENLCVQDQGSYVYSTSPFDGTVPARVYYKMEVCAAGDASQPAACDSKVVKVINDTAR